MALRPPYAPLLALALVLATPEVALAQDARVTATADRTTLSLHEELTVSISIEGAVEQLQPPAFTDFAVVSEGVTRVLNGRRSSLTRNYRLRPKKNGRLTIGPAKGLRDGRVVAASRPITVTVKQPAAAKPVDVEVAQDLGRYQDQGLFLRLHAPRERFYVGDPFPLTLQVFYQADYQVTSVELLSAPKLDGLLVEEIGSADGRERPRRAKVGATTMSWYPLSEQLATPLKAGRLLIDPATVRLGLGRGLFSSEQRYTRASQPFWIDVEEIPTEGRPPTFDDGNVGRFRLDAALTDDRGQRPAQVRTGERLVLRAEVSGEGNLLTLKAPRITASDAFDVQPLPGAAEDEIVKDSRGMHGRRTFRYLVTPLAPGQHEGPTMTLSFFDTRAGRFVTRAVPGGALTVTGDPITGDGGAAAQSGEDVGPIIEEARLERSSRTPLSQTPLYWALLAVPMAALLLVEVRWRLRRRDLANPGRRQARTALANSNKRLRAADQAMRDGLVKDFYGQIARTLMGYLEERANIPAAGMTHDELRAAARDTGYRPDLVDAVIVELENCDFARFAPQGSASDKMRETRERTATLLRDLDQTSPRRRP